MSEAVYLFTCGKYLVDAEQFLRSGSLTGKPVYWGRTSCALSVSRLVTSRSTWIVRSTFYPAEQVDLSIVTAVTFR